MRVLMIEARWAIRIADDLRRAGHALDGLLKEVGLVRADLSSPEDRIPYAAYVGLIERAAVLLGIPVTASNLGLRTTSVKRLARIYRPKLAYVERRLGEHRTLRQGHQ